MKIFLDTASIESIKKYNDKGLVEGMRRNAAGPAWATATRQVEGAT